MVVMAHWVARVATADRAVPVETLLVERVREVVLAVTAAMAIEAAKAARAVRAVLASTAWR